MLKRVAKPLAFVICLLPLACIGVDFARDAMADPVANSLNRLGFWTLTLLCISLACTPAKILANWNWPNKLRRMLGLFAFFYASLHFLVYCIVDQELNVQDIWADVSKRKFITVGFAAFLLLIPLAVTSTQKMTRRLGFKAWKRLHRMSYAVAVLGVIHFVWRVKADFLEPALFAGVLALLMGVRVVDALRRVAAAPASRNAQ